MPRQKALRRAILGWYRSHARDLPWRRTTDPYRILVSEVMLQQTQVARAIPAYRDFLRAFPTRSALARAPLGRVLRLWGGLGYPRRARDLHRAARAVAQLPTERAALDALPGIGPYTAGAVACFATGAPVAFADTNIRRVLGRMVLGRTATDREALAIDEELMPRADAARWHHALMDLGATVCVARAPRCDACPVLAFCRSRGRDGAPVRRRQRPFATSDRRIRGAIMRLLRSRPRAIALAALRREIADPRVDRLVAALADEGLIERTAASVRLPA